VGKGHSSSVKIMGHTSARARMASMLSSYRALDLLDVGLLGV